MKLLSLLASMCVLSGCVVLPNPGPDRRPNPPGTINHIVFIDLKNPTLTKELIRDLDILFNIPDITSGYVGTHYDIGRESVHHDYDVGFFVAFDSEEAYRNYIEHPFHKSFIEKWKTQCESIRVYDVGDERPVRMVM